MGWASRPVVRRADGQRGVTSQILSDVSRLWQTLCLHLYHQFGVISVLFHFPLLVTCFLICLFLIGLLWLCALHYSDHKPLLHSALVCNTAPPSSHRSARAPWPHGSAAPPPGWLHVLSLWGGLSGGPVWYNKGVFIFIFFLYLNVPLV